MAEEKIKSEKPRINARLWRKEVQHRTSRKKRGCGGKKRNKETQKYQEKSEFMEIKRGGKKKKTQKKQEKVRLWRKENKDTEILRKSKKMEKNH